MGGRDRQTERWRESDRDRGRGRKTDREGGREGRIKVERKKAKKRRGAFV